ncbi:MAG: 30S ribosomal protein S13 [Verrucomicrobia bacterium TMED71]|uniref:30S ribosomal protein S13 n=1 Tax=Candidatus Pelagisphaera phototrophica TaxID=2684113 RepID=UPI000B69DD7F|nr:30S ribosomal protein S13 [Candidatus Pelagisphaera phototrophica]QXD31910.1 30S ribosomal protein S13 [Candidatus Pelagisphaera phototrophica]RPF82489.1 MAG: 30S ribosomal protein S13 [Verrucomicrobia bacterium TMED71]
MPRILGVDIPNNKKLAYSLRYIYGIGPKRADIILEQTGLDPDMRAKDLDEEQINVIMSKISELSYLVEGDLRRDHAANMKRLQAINCYRGLRHRRGLPVRGQRTKTNARTRKGKTASVGGLRK